MSHGSLGWLKAAWGVSWQLGVSHGSLGWLMAAWGVSWQLGWLMAAWGGSRGGSHWMNNKPM